MTHTMSDHSHIRLVLFLTRSTPLATWHQVGIIEREAALYRRLRPHIGSLQIVTSGGPEELQYQDYLGDVEILYNRHGLSPNVYSLVAPLIHREALAAATIYKTNQLDGAWTAILAGKRYHKPVLVRAGYLWASTFAKSAGPSVKTRLARPLEHYALRHATGVILTTEVMKQQVMADSGVEADRITVIPNFVDTDRFRPDPTVTPIPGRICFVGRLDTEKNLAALLEAMTHLPGASLTLIGQGNHQAQLEAYARQHNLTVEFLGRVPNTELPALIQQAQVFILPSLYEGHPKSLIEAMACGAAVVGSDVQGINTVIDHERTGLLCTPDAAGIAAALRRLLDDEPLRACLGQAARAHAEQHFSLASIVDRELALMQRIQAQQDAR